MSRLVTLWPGVDTHGAAVGPAAVGLLRQAAGAPRLDSAVLADTGGRIFHGWALRLGTGRGVREWALTVGGRWPT